MRIVVNCDIYRFGKAIQCTLDMPIHAVRHNLEAIVNSIRPAMRDHSHRNKRSEQHCLETITLAHMLIRSLRIYLFMRGHVNSIAKMLTFWQWRFYKCQKVCSDADLLASATL
jgi:hypothetical protein